MLHIPLSEMTASAPRSQDFTRIPAKARCTINHPVIRRDYNDWRDTPDKLRISHSCLGDLPDVIPLATNGILFISAKGDGLFVGHVTNLVKPEAIKNFMAKPKVEAPKKPKVSKEKVINVSLEELFI